MGSVEIKVRATEFPHSSSRDVVVDRRCEERDRRGQGGSDGCEG